MPHLLWIAGLLFGILFSGCATVPPPQTHAGHEPAYDLYGDLGWEEAAYNASAMQPAVTPSIQPAPTKSTRPEASRPRQALTSSEQDPRFAPAAFVAASKFSDAKSGDKTYALSSVSAIPANPSLPITKDDETGPVEIMATPAPSGEAGTVGDEAEIPTVDNLINDESKIDLPAIPGTGPDIWDRIRQGYALLPDLYHPRAAAHLEWYASHADYLDRVVERARPYLYDIVQEVHERGMPMEIALLPVVESAFQPFAYSPGRAAGIWQFIPGTGKLYGLKQNWWYDGRRDIRAATHAALNYLENLSATFDGDWLLALASYNSGEGAVKRAIAKNQAKGLKTDFWSLDLPRETREYVPRLLAISALVADPETYGVTLGSISDESYLERVEVGGQIDLALAAELAEVPLREMYNYNPGFNRWATDPDGPHHLLIPKTKAELFRQNLAGLPAEKRVQWQRHEIKSGETLGTIAQRYNTSIGVLQQLNGITGKWIRAGDSLIIPVATRNLDTYILSADQRRQAIQNAPRDGSKIQHIVKSGDTLWELSVKYDVSVANLASWNSMAPSEPLLPGQKLVIWGRERNLASSLGQQTALPDQVNQQRVQYRVRKGDSLARISQKFNVTVEQLRNWNTLNKNEYIQPGQLLTVYVDITRQAENS